MDTFRFPLSVEVLGELCHSPWTVISCTPATPQGHIKANYDTFLMSVARDNNPPTTNTIIIALCFEVVLNHQTRNLIVETLDPMVRYRQWIEAISILFPNQLHRLADEDIQLAYPVPTRTLQQRPNNESLQEENRLLRLTLRNQHSRVVLHFYAMTISHQRITQSKAEIVRLRRREQQLKSRMRAINERLKKANNQRKLSSQQNKDLIKKLG